ncbi:hypothetical protein [Candidatus Neptunochlamydia vexilliferae]|uniref:Uncharacterized protein n=1 Tax=Candidatus Neptunichlamydia vexilliferae TaxID=1651774 RepID=A0ABS0B0T8_9BACT|nr:hypothetical protein [Candidatus Neptunochlamydia vexilliferae]MBF5059982.1 hypothetical protein [Candidatus Neptunochlamydia vexilliferae]
MSASVELKKISVSANLEFIDDKKDAQEALRNLFWTVYPGLKEGEVHLHKRHLFHVCFITTKGGKQDHFSQIKRAFTSIVMKKNF